MRKKQPQYGILSGLSAIAVLLAAATILPHAGSKPDLLGARTLCAFVPLSTLILLGLAAFFRILREGVCRTPTNRAPD